MEHLEKWDILCWEQGGNSTGEYDGPIEESVTVKCWDNCTAMSIIKWSDEPDYQLVLYKTYGTSFWYRLKEGLRYIFKIKNIFNSDLILTPEEMDKIIKFKTENE